MDIFKNRSLSSCIGAAATYLADNYKKVAAATWPYALFAGVAFAAYSHFTTAVSVSDSGWLPLGVSGVAVWAAQTLLYASFSRLANGLGLWDNVKRVLGASVVMILVLAAFAVAVSLLSVLFGVLLGSGTAALWAVAAVACIAFIAICIPMCNLLPWIVTKGGNPFKAFAPALAGGFRHYGLLLGIFAAAALVGAMASIVAALPSAVVAVANIAMHGLGGVSEALAGIPAPLSLLANSVSGFLMAYVSLFSFTAFVYGHGSIEVKSGRAFENAVAKEGGE